MGFVFDELSGKIISAAIEVHKKLGPGFLEAVYQHSLEIELANRRIPYESQKQIEVTYEGMVVGTHVLDLVVDGNLVVELKAVKAFEEIHYAQLRSYLRATNIKVGLLVNFNSPTLSAKRVVN